jgi:COMPASS component SWD3
MLGYSNGYVCVFNIETGEARTMKDGDYPITSLRWKNSHDLKPKNILVAVSADGKITHWHTSSGKTLHVMEQKDNPIMCMDFNPDGNIFATAGTDKKVRLYDDDTKTLLRVMKPGDFNHPGHSNRIFSLNFHKENTNLLASGGWDNTIQFYDLRDGTVVQSIFGPHICGDSIDMKGDYLLTGSWSIENQIQIWDIRTFKLVADVKWENDKPSNPTYLYSAQFSKNSKSNLFAVGGSNGNIFRVFENETEQKLPQATSKYMSSACYSVDFGNMSNLISVGCGDGVIRAYSAKRKSNE